MTTASVHLITVYTPTFATALIELTGDKAAPGLWMSFAAMCGLFGAWILYRRASTA